jgi:putative transcriptional regulator
MGGLSLVLALAVATPAVLRGQVEQIRDLAPGKFLVAARKLPDPNFAQTVVLLCRHDEKGTMGLVINRQTRLSFDKVFEQLREAKDRGDSVFLGGPVQISGVLALLRSKSKPEDAMHVFEDLYLVSNKPALEKAVTAGFDSTHLRIYLGYSGWSRGQLVRELEMGAWHILRGDPNFVFDSDPDTVWTRLIKRTELPIAGFGPESGNQREGRFPLRLNRGARQD